MVSFYSFFVAVLYFNLCLLIVSKLRKQTLFMAKYSSSMLLLMAGLGVVRMLVPLDFNFAYIISSFTIMPALRDVLIIEIVYGLSVGDVLLLLWAGGIVCMLFIQWKSVMRDCRAIRRIQVTRNEKVERIWADMKLSHAKLVVSPDVGTPMVSGFFTAHIFVPDIALSRSEWEVILCHEYQHFKNRDTWVKLFHLLVAAFLWWNPIVHRFNRELDNLLELRCDASVCKSMSVQEKQGYLRTILAVLTQLHDAMPTAQVALKSALVVTDSEEFIIQRFQLVLDDGKKELRPQLTAFSLVVVTFLLSYLVVFQPAGYPVGDMEEIGVSIRPENAYILVQEDNSVALFVDGEYFHTLDDADLQREPWSKLAILDTWV